MFIEKFIAMYMHLDCHLFLWNITFFTSDKNKCLPVKNSLSCEWKFYSHIKMISQFLNLDIFILCNQAQLSIGINKIESSTIGYLGNVSF